MTDEQHDLGPEILELARELAGDQNVDLVSFAWGLVTALTVLAHDRALVAFVAGRAPVAVDLGDPAWREFATLALWARLEANEDRLRREALDAFLGGLVAGDDHADRRGG